MPLPFQLLFVVVLVLLVHHCADFHGQTEQVDEYGCILMVIQLTGSEEQEQRQIIVEMEAAFLL